MSQSPKGESGRSPTSRVWLDGLVRGAILAILNQNEPREKLLLPVWSETVHEMMKDLREHDCGDRCEWRMMGLARQRELVRGKEMGFERYMELINWTVEKMLRKAVLKHFMGGSA